MSVTEMRPRLSLYDVSLEGMLIASILEETEGELTPEIEARMDALMQAGTERVEAAAMVVRSLEANASACKIEAQRLLERAASFDRQTEQLKERMTIAIDTAFGGKIKTPRFTAWTQAPPDYVAFDISPNHSIEEVEAADPSLVRVKKELDRVALKERFKAGEALPPAIHFMTAPGKRYTRIK